MKNPIFKSFADISAGIPNAIICLRSIRDDNKQIINFEWLLLNEYAMIFFGAGSDRLIGKPFFRLKSSVEEIELFNDYASVVISGKPFCKELPHDNKSHHGGFFATAMKYEDGLIITYEVAEQVITRKNIAKQADDLRVILETIPQIAWTAAPDGAVTYFNQRYFEYAGATAGEAGSLGWQSVIHPAMLDQYLQAMKHSITTGADFYVESLFKSSKDRSYRWHLSRAIAIRNENGKITSWVGTATDINDQKTLEEELRKLQALEKVVRLKAEAQTAWLNNMVMQAPFIVCTLRGPDYVHELINPSYQELFGDRELAGRKIVDVLSEYEAQIVIKFLHNVYNKGETLTRKEVRLLIAGRHGERSKEIFADITCQPLYDYNKNIEGILIFAYVVTDQVLARKALEKNAEDLKIILEAIPQIAWVAKPDGKIDYYNKKWYNYTGLSVDQTVKDGWIPVLHPDMRERTISDWLHSVNTGENFDIETMYKRGSDQSYRWHLSQAHPVRDMNGVITLWVGISTDIDDSKNMRDELENLVHERTRDVMRSNEDLKLSNIKLEEFAFIASHDLKEPLRKIITNSDFLRMEFFDQLLVNGKQYINRIQDSAHRMQKLIDDLLALSQLSYIDTGFEKIDLNKLLIKICDEQSTTFTDMAPEISIRNLPVIEGIPTLIEQLFNNLVSNALKFVKPGETPKINISFKNFTGKNSRVPNALPGKKYCAIYVKDNGIGFNNKHVDLIFIIFKRLNSQHKYQGTGIGLALCRKIVENHHGFITAKSQVNKGSTFIVTVPYQQNK